MRETVSKNTVERSETVSVQNGWIENFLLLFGTIVLCFVIGELVARIFVPAPLQWLWPQTIYVSSHSLGFRLKPNQSAYTADKAFRTNSMGIRGPERTWRKPPGVRRILILGDSIAFGYGVRYEDTFANRLENLLNQSKGRYQYEVINAGVPSYNTTQEVTYFLEEGILFEPDLVVLAFYWNDIHNKKNVKVDNLGHLIEESNKQRHVLLKRLYNSKKGYMIRNLIKKSRFLYFVIYRLRLLFNRNYYTTQMMILHGKINKIIKKGWNDIDKQLCRFVRFVNNRKIKILLVILPMPQQLEKFFPNIKYQLMIRKYCKKYDIHCLDLLPVFRNYYTTHTSLFISYDGDHPNERGHAIIARELYKEIKYIFHY
jgi:lysophospholipase L1-like esterase